MSGSPISKQEVADLCRRIRALRDDERPSWALIESLAAQATGRNFTRQALGDHKSVRKVYDERLKAYRKRRRTGKSADDRSASTDDRIKRRLRADIESLQETLAEFDRRLLAIVAHCTLKGLDVGQIDILSPIPTAAGASSVRRGGRARK